LEAVDRTQKNAVDETEKLIQIKGGEENLKPSALVEVTNRKGASPQKLICIGIFMATERRGKPEGKK